MLKTCNLREGLLVALMSIGTLTAEAAIDPSGELNSMDCLDCPSKSEEDLDLISKFELELKLFDLKTQLLRHQMFEAYLSGFQEYCVSDTIEEICKIPIELLSEFTAALSGYATLQFVNSYYQEYTLTKVKKNFVLYRDKFKGPLSTAIEKLEGVNRNGTYLNLNSMSKEIAARRIHVLSHILGTMDKEIHEILKITQKEHFASAMQIMEKRIDRASKLSKIQIYTSKIKTPSPYNYLNLLDTNNQEIIHAIIKSHVNESSSEEIIEARLEELKEKGFLSSGHFLSHLTRLPDLTRSALGVIMFGSVTLFVLDNAFVLFSPGPISSQLDELRHEIDEIQVEINQLEKLKDIVL